MSHETLPGLRDAVDAGLPHAIADLSNLVRIPSVAWDGFDFAHVEASAEAVRALFEATGVFELIEVRRATAPSGQPGQPAVVATRAARNGKPTILLYAHHDVQPSGNDEEWDSLPFEPTVRGDRLYGRGTADDKAGVVSHIAAIRALVETVGPDFDLGIAVFVEGEEEFGSRSFKNFLEANKAELQADVIVVADSGNWDVETPAITVALRGNVTCKLTISTLDHASHSGMFGGAVPDAMLAAIRLLATLHNEDGSIAIDGLVSHTAATPAYDEAKLREEAGVLDGVTPIGSGAILDRLWYQPALTVTGIDAPSVQNASNTLQPSVTVKLSLRLAPGQDSTLAFEALEKHLREHAPFGARLAFSDVDKGNPFLVDTSGWAVAEATDAMAEAWEKDAVHVGAGGSIPFIADLVELFPAAQVLVTGVEDPDSRAHSPNESLHLGVFRRGILSEAILLAKLNSRT
jgi:acetylornithine deacetylase/succinyl-diaminopimelate desuccinylase-like protein